MNRGLVAIITNTIPIDAPTTTRMTKEKCTVNAPGVEGRINTQMNLNIRGAVFLDDTLLDCKYLEKRCIFTQILRRFF